MREVVLNGGVKNGTRSLSEKWETLLGCWLTVGKIKWKGPLLHWCQYLSRKHIRRYIYFKQFICLDAVLFLRLFSDVKKEPQSIIELSSHTWPIQYHSLISFCTVTELRHHCHNCWPWLSAQTGVLYALDINLSLNNYSLFFFC